MGVTILPTSLTAFLLDISEAWDMLDMDEQYRVQDRAKGLGLCGPANYDGEQQLTEKGYAALAQFQWIQSQNNNVMGEL